MILILLVRLFKQNNQIVRCMIIVYVVIDVIQKYHKSKFCSYRQFTRRFCEQIVFKIRIFEICVLKNVLKYVSSVCLKGAHIDGDEHFGMP